MKRQIKSLISKSGLDIHWLKNLPFGVRWEEDVRGLLGGIGHPTFLDIGANVGQTAQSLAQVFPNSKIYSFEPVPTTFAKLQQNTASLPQVQCINMALGETLGEAVVTSDRDGLNTLLAGVPSSDSTVTKVGTVDDFCSEHDIQRVDLLKTDTEGFETFVLKGASEMFAKGNVDFVLAECDFVRRPDQPHGDFFEIYSMLTQFGFTLVSFYTGGVDQRGWVWGNLLMMREGVADGLQVVVSPNARAARIRSR